MFNLKVRTVVFLASLLLTACKESADDFERMSMVVDGLPIYGSAKDAKSNGFTLCEVVGKDYKCIADRTVNIYGIPAENAYVRIGRESHAYYDVFLFVEREKYDSDCMGKIESIYFLLNKPEECALPSGMLELKSALSKNGWIVSPSSFHNEFHFYNRDYSVKIALKRNDRHYPNVVISTVGAEFAMTQWNEAKVIHDRDIAIREKEKAVLEQEEASKPEADAFINFMKQ